MGAKKKAFSLIEFLRGHQNYEGIGPQGLALYYHLICETKTSAPYGLWKTTKAWAGGVPLEREDIVVGIRALENNGLLVRDELNSMIYLIGAQCAERAVPTTAGLANRVTKKIKDTTSYSLRALMAYEAVLNARVRGLVARAKVEEELISVLSSFESIDIPVYLLNPECPPIRECVEIDKLILYGHPLLSRVYFNLQGSYSRDITVKNVLDRDLVQFLSGRAIGTKDYLTEYLSGVIGSRKKEHKVTGTRELLLSLAAVFEEETGRTYAINWHNEAKMAKEALYNLNPEEITGRFRDFLADPWFKEKGFQDLKRFFNSINRWKAKAAQPAKNDDWFEKMLKAERNRKS